MDWSQSLFSKNLNLLSLHKWTMEQFQKILNCNTKRLQYLFLFHVGCQKNRLPFAQIQIVTFLEGINSSLEMCWLHCKCKHMVQNQLVVSLFSHSDTSNDFSTTARSLNKVYLYTFKSVRICHSKRLNNPSFNKCNSLEQRTAE